MNCYLSGILGLAMLGASVSTMSVTEEQHNLLRSTFSDELDEIYGKIVIERRNHYVLGLILGVALAYVSLSLVKIANRFHKTSLFVLVTLMTAVVFYFLMPKSDYMLNHLKTEEQNKAWLEVYKTMKQRYFLGFLLGALAAIPLANSMC
jgi:uncharacterized protein YacL